MDLSNSLKSVAVSSVHLCLTSLTGRVESKVKSEMPSVKIDEAKRNESIEEKRSEGQRLRSAHKRDPTCPLRAPGIR